MPNWNHVNSEIEKATANGDPAPFDTVRRKYLSKLNQHTGRNVICYYSGFLQKPKVEGSEVNDDDKNGFMACIHGMERDKGLDLFLHTPGGDIGATESLVHYLKEMFPDIRAVVPQISMSAGTMMACSFGSILMGKHSNIGPIDPQFSGIPAIGVIAEVEKAFADIVTDERYSLVWNPILSQLPPSFVQQCLWAKERSEEFIQKALETGMMKDAEDKDIKKAVDRLTDLTYNKGHNRHIHYAECREIGLKVELLEEGEKTLQDLVLTVHHCFMHTLANTAAFKIVEDHRGRAQVRLQAQQQTFLQLPPEVTNAFKEASKPEAAH
jgi:hypothetical protein